MAYPPSRSASAELREGATDGKYRKVNGPDRGGVEEMTTLFEREDLNPQWYGIAEKQVKRMPDGRSVTTPRYRHIAPADPSFV